MWVRTYYMHQWLEQEHVQCMPGLAGPSCPSSAYMPALLLSFWGLYLLHRLRRHLTRHGRLASSWPAIAKKKVCKTKTR